MNRMSKGKVYLIGAGPGDEQLLTLKADRLISKAEVVVYDRLVSRSILSKIPETAIKINVGKNAGNHPVPQDEINRILLEKAQEGYNVVRLKGGDSFMFGRGGEELELLYQNNIPFEVVPGITSPIAAAAYAGIPVTHRDFCSSLHIITGHKKKDGELDLDYQALVKLNGTLVFMMSVSSAGEIMNGLIKAGMSEQTECAVIENGTLPSQRKFVSVISKLADTIEQNNVKSPALIVVGRVCSLSEQFDWFSKLALKGKRILVTRPKASSSRLSEKLSQLGADVTLLPSIKTVPTEFEMPKLDEYTMLVFTSENGVASFFNKLLGDGLDARALFNKRVAVVGRETAKAILQYGIKADFIPKVFNGEALASEMLADKFVSTNDKLLILRAKKSAPELTDILVRNKIPYDEVSVYETELLKVDLANKVEFNPNDYDIITFTSASCVDGFALMAGESKMSNVTAKCICIGEQTAKQARKYGIDAVISKEATIDSMIETIMEHSIAI